MQVGIICEPEISATSVINIDGQADVTISYSSFVNCAATSNGGAVQATGSVAVRIVESQFKNSWTAGSGGALSVNGGTVSLSGALFEHCLSVQSGGAISAIGSLLNITNSRFFDCSSRGGGGAIVITGGSTIVSSTSLSQCSSDNDGGGIMQFDAVFLNISDSLFTNLSSGGYGGGITTVGGTSQIKNSSFLSCKSFLGGGALFASQSQCYGTVSSGRAELFLYSMTFDKCSSDGSGGTLFAATGDVFVFVLNSSFTESQSVSSGGAISASGGSQLTILDSYFFNNSCLELGGAISSDGSLISVQSSTFLKCISLLSGGAISMISASSTTVDNASFFQNVAYGPGGGAVYCQNAHLTMRSFLDSGNAAPTGGGGFLFWEGPMEPFVPALIVNTGPQKYFSLSGQISVLRKCEAVNQALYGPCVASSGKFLFLVGIPTSGAPAYPGLPFSISVVKRDAYNQSIITDSSSVLFAETARGGNIDLVDPYVSISGNSIVQLQKGTAEFSIMLRPIFSEITWFSNNNSGLAVLASQPFIYFYGTDIETMLPIYSEAFPVVFEPGSKVCPVGYVLTVEVTETSGLLSGICVQCLSGKYSVNPLAGSAAGKPSCLDCPAGGTCEGGNEVSFLIGRWLVIGGIYRLVSCPAGYQLFNMIGGQFSHDIQQCLQCGKDQYIIDSNNSAFSCQTCPAGATCDGSNLYGLVVGSVWVANLVSGQYVLSSCPSGYQLQSATQECQLCPPGYFCQGGAEPAQTCPSGYFSVSGANSSSACTRATFIYIVVSLPLSKQNFTGVIQDKFVTAISLTGGIPYDNIFVQNIMARRRGGSSISISCQIAVNDIDTASAVVNRFDSDNLNRNLLLEGLPQGSVVSVTTNTATAANGNNWMVVIIVVVVGCLAVLLIISVILIRRVESEEERVLRLAMKSLRGRLKIMPSNAFLLSTESALTSSFSAIPIPWSQAGKETTIIQKSYLEAAARLSLMLVRVLRDHVMLR